MKNNNLHNSVEKYFLTPNQAADLLSISLSTMKKLIYQGKVKTFMTPGGHHRILRSDLFNSLKKHDFFAGQMKAASKTGNVAMESIYAFSMIIQNRYKFCRGHAAVVSEISIQIAKGLSFSEAEIERVAKAGLLHDIGMIGVPDAIINKEGPLDSNEYEIVKNHPSMGAEILANFSMFEDILPIIEQHHERVDGMGYPHGIKNGNICVGAKIVALAESFDCMTSENSYTRSLGFDEALEHIKDGSGTQFDPAVVKAFLLRAKYIITEAADR